MSRWTRCVWAGIAAVALAACGGGSGSTDPTTRNVPNDHATIQEAVDASSPGDLILIEAGVYAEQVIVDVADIVIRGVDRNEVVLDGDNTLFDGFLVVADGVAIENLTVKRYRQNGVIFTGLVGYSSTGSDPDEGEPLERYRVSHVTAINNGTYGIYAFASRDGTITDTYASGHPDSGFYIGQCKPCNVVLDNVTAERNSIGYYGTNASGGVFVVRSTFVSNRLGLTPNSQNSELLAPQIETVIAGNLVIDNDDPTAPAIPDGFFGGGIAIGGGTENTIVRNRIEGHDVFGLGLVPLQGFEARDNVIDGNVFDGNGVDIVVDTGGDAAGNCFVGNEIVSEVPASITSLLACGSAAASFDAESFGLPAAPPPIDYTMVVEPGPQPTMDNARTAPALPVAAPAAVDVSTITVPDRG